MLQKIRNNKKESKGFAAAGFTIIEVMIVLAIAGLIMAIVFLAIPGLQKTNRNTQRKNDVSRVSSLTNDFIANNNGTLPITLNFLTASVAKTLDLTKEKFSIIDVSADNTLTDCDAVKCGMTTGATPVPILPSATITAPANDYIKYFKHADCGTGLNVPVYNTSSRSFAIWYGIEGSTTTQCVAG